MRDITTVLCSAGTGFASDEEGNYYSDMYHIAVDDYVVDVLLPDLAGHDRSPAAFLVYLVLWTRLFRSERRAAAVSLNTLASQTGLSKSAVQGAIRLLRNRSLIKVTRASPTAVPHYELIRHWLKRRAKKAVGLPVVARRAK